MSKPVKNVVVTGGAGAIAYSLLFRIANGDMLGHDQPISLRIVELPDFIKSLEGIRMELEDCAFPLLTEIKIGADPIELFQDADYAILVGSKPRGPGMERADVMKDNAKIFVEQGAALNISAKKETVVFVVGNPCNTNCLIAMHNAPSIQATNFHAMTRLDQNRSVGMLAAKASVSVTEVSRMTIWGNHSATQVPDFTNATIEEKPATEVIDNRKWFEEEFVPRVQKRGAEIIAARGKSSAASAANAIIDGVRAIVTPTPSGQWYSSAIYSKGNPYGIDEDLVFSFPCRTLDGGSIEIVPDLPWDEFIRPRVLATEKELIEERSMVQTMLNPTRSNIYG